MRYCFFALHDELNGRETGMLKLFLVHDAETLVCRLGPALASCFRHRSFEPIRKLLDACENVIRATSARFHLGPDDRPICLNRELRFDRRVWRQVAGELLLLLAAETPSFPLAPDLLARFIDPVLVARLHRGSRELYFGGIPYRPDHAAVHSRSDLDELVECLSPIDPTAWTTRPLGDVPSDEQADELEFVRQRFGDLTAMIESARNRRQVIVCEEV